MNKKTVIFIIFIVVSIIIFDVIALYVGGTEASISYALIVWSYDYPVFTFVMGFVMGHLFWRLRSVGKLLENKDEK